MSKNGARTGFINFPSPRATKRNLRGFDAGERGIRDEITCSHFVCCCGVRVGARNAGSQRPELLLIPCSEAARRRAAPHTNATLVPAVGFSARLAGHRSRARLTPMIPGCVGRLSGTMRSLGPTSMAVGRAASRRRLRRRPMLQPVRLPCSRRTRPCGLGTSWSRIRVSASSRVAIGMTSRRLPQSAARTRTSPDGVVCLLWSMKAACGRRISLTRT